MEQEAYGRHIIKSWPRGHLWQARAYIGDRQVGQLSVADDREKAVAELKQALDIREEKLAAGKGEHGTPSAIEYAEALDRIGPLPASYEAMLAAHLDAPNHTITATKLAEAAGYPNWNSANLHYGKLGQLIADELGYNPPRRANGTVMSTATIASWDPNRVKDEEHPHFEWIMRPQMVEVLGSRSKA